MSRFCARIVRSAGAVIAGAVLGSLARPVVAEPQLVVERENVLAFNMGPEELDPVPRSTPYRAGTGPWWTTRVQHPGAGELRLEVRASSLGRGPWELRVLDGERRVVETLDPKAAWTAGHSLWTAPVKGEVVVLELSAEADPGVVELEVPRYAHGEAAAAPEAVHGIDQLRPIGRAPAAVQPWGEPVTRLRIMLGDGREAFCSGFLVADDLVLTNHHCISTSSEARSTVADFRYDDAGVAPTRIRVVSLESANRGLDYAIVRLARSAGLPRLDLRRARAAQESEALVIIQHPAGRPKEVSLDDCIVSGATRAGIERDGTDFGHECDTLGGSSGSPVLAVGTGSVVGLHHLGFHPDSPDPVNQAVHIRQILEHLRLGAPAIHGRIASD